MNGAMTGPRGARGDKAEQLTAADKEYTATYLSETDENRASAIEDIRCWIAESDDLCSRTDESFILRFLRTCKFNVEKTKIRMRNYLQLRSDIPEWFTNMDPLLPEMQELLQLGVFLPLLKLDNQGRMVIFIRPHLRKPYKQKLSDLLKVAFLIMETAEDYQMPGSLRGVVVFLDLESMSFGYLIELRPNFLKKTVHIWQGCCPLRIKTMTFINIPTYMNFIVMIMKTFMSEKLQKRFNVFVSDTENKWAKDLPADVLPVEYGGTGCKLDELKEFWKKTVEENREQLMHDEKYKIVSDAKNTSPSD